MDDCHFLGVAAASNLYLFTHLGSGRYMGAFHGADVQQAYCLLKEQYAYGEAPTLDELSWDVDRELPFI